MTFLFLTFFLPALAGNTIAAIFMREKSVSLLYWLGFLMVMAVVTPVKAIKGRVTEHKAIESHISQADAIRELEMSPWTRAGAWEAEKDKQVLKGQKQYHEDYKHLEVCGCGLAWCSTDKPEGWDKFCKNGDLHFFDLYGECRVCKVYDKTKSESYRMYELERKELEEKEKRAAEIARVQNVIDQLDSGKATVEYDTYDDTDYVVNLDGDIVASYSRGVYVSKPTKLQLYTCKTNHTPKFEYYDGNDY